MYPVVFHRVQNRGVVSQTGAHGHLPHNGCAVDSFGQKEHFAVLPGEIIQIAKRNCPIGGERVVHFPGRAVVRVVYAEQVVIRGIRQHVQQKRLPKRIALQEENNSACQRTIGERLLDSAQSCQAVSLGGQQKTGSLRRSKGFAHFLRVMVEEGGVVPRGAVMAQIDGGFWLDALIRRLIERMLSIEQIEARFPGIQIAVKRGFVPGFCFPQPRPGVRILRAKDTMQNCQQQAV